MLEKIVFGLAGVGLTAIAGGIAFIVNFEGRITKLETQSNFALGVSAGASIEEPFKSSNASGKTPDLLQQAIANSCAKMADSYAEIVAAGSIYSSEQQRLDALSSQMTRLNCARQ